VLQDELEDDVTSIITALFAGTLLLEPCHDVHMCPAHSVAAVCAAVCLQGNMPAVWLQLLQLCTNSEVCGQQAQEWLTAYAQGGGGGEGWFPGFGMAHHAAKQIF
jgi:hypothetical protein